MFSRCRRIFLGVFPGGRNSGEEHWRQKQTPSSQVKPETGAQNHEWKTRNRNIYDMKQNFVML